MPIRIYTRTGDEGQTGLFGGERVAKDDLRVEAYGTVDELNAEIGFARTYSNDSEITDLLHSIQNDLFTVGADLATPETEPTQRGKVQVKRIDASYTAKLEEAIDRFETELPALTRFILPGGSALAAVLHRCRVVCRRAERRCVTLVRELEMEQAVLNPEIVRYLNRLSDLFFVVARVANHRVQHQDIVWEP